MDIYNYHPVTGEYLGASVADESPLEPGEWLVPANASKAAPPDTLTNEVAVMGAAGWSVKPDFRGTVYWLADGSKHEIDAIGDEPPTDALFQEPPPSVSDYAASKKVDISDSLSTVLSSGFTCSNGITMDAYDGDVAKLDDGYRLAQRLGATTMDIRDHANTRHLGVALANVEQMVNELGQHYMAKLSEKWSLQEEVDAIVARNQLTPTDPNYDTDYLDDTAARSAIDAVALVT